MCHTIWSTLRILEIAERLSVSLKHIVALIEGAKLRAINVGMKSLSGRRYWRIPIESYRKFILQNLS